MSIVPLIILKPHNLFNDSTLLSYSYSKGPSDIFGLYRWAQIFEFGINRFGYSSYTNFPYGEFLLTKESLSQSFQLLLIKFLSVIFSANQTVNLLTFFNWVLIGTSVFSLSMMLNFKKSIALLCGVYCQLQPTIIQTSLTVPSMMYIHVIIYAIYFYFKYKKDLGNTSLNLSILLFTIPIFIDLYLYYFSIIVFTILIINSIILKDNFGKNSFLNKVTGTFPFIPLLLIHIYSKFQEISYGGRILKPVSKELLDANGMRIRDYIKPLPGSFRDKLDCPLICESPYSFISYGNIGLGFLLFSVFALLFTLLRFKLDNLIKQLSIICIFVFLLTLKSQLVVGDFVVQNPILEIRHLMIGALYIERVVVLFVILSIVIVFGTVNYMFKSYFLNQKFLLLLMTCFVTINTLDIYSPALSVSVNNQREYSKIIKESHLKNGGGILFLPNSFLGRNWLEQVYFGLPMSNSLFDAFAIDDLNRENALELSCNLKKNKISYVVSITKLEANLFTNNILLADSQFFEIQSSQLVSGYEDRYARLTVFKIKCPI